MHILYVGYTRVYHLMFNYLSLRYAGQLNKTVLFACTTVEAILKVLNDDISVHVKDIYDSVVPLLKSPLGAPSCRNLFISLGRAAFDSKSLGIICQSV